MHDNHRCYSVDVVYSVSALVPLWSSYEKRIAVPRISTQTLDERPFSTKLHLSGTHPFQCIFASELLFVLSDFIGNSLSFKEKAFCE